MALAFSTLFLLVNRVTSSVGAACVATVTAGLCHMCWWMSTVAEVYSLSLLFIMVELYLLCLYSQKRAGSYLFLLFAVNGAHFAVHNVALLALPVYGIVLILFLFRDVKKNFWPVLFAAAVWVVAGSMIWWQAIGLLSNGTGVAGVVESILFGDGYQSHVTGVANFNLSLFLANMALAAVSFISPCWLLAPIGFFQCKRLKNGIFFRALIALTLIHFLFWIRYFVPDQATFILPLLGVLAVWCGVGFAVLQRRFSSKYTVAYVVILGALVNLCFLSVAPTAARHLLGSVNRSRVPPGRDEWGYWLQPWKHNEISAQRFVDKVGGSLGSGDILYADSTTAAPLMAVEALTQGAVACKVLSPWTVCDQAEIELAISAGRFYVVSPVAGYVPGWLLTGEYEFQRRGAVSRVSRSNTDVDW